jgi:threonine dehydrogenase-like Zn-dependent dehydrogenase
MGNTQMTSGLSTRCSLWHAAKPMSKAVRFYKQGGHRLPRIEEVSTPVPGRDEVLLRMHAVGLNHADLSLYRVPSGIPSERNYGLGLERTGTVELLGRESLPLGWASACVPCLPNFC